MQTLRSLQFVGQSFLRSQTGIAKRNPISQNYIDHVMKFLPTLRQYDLHRAADFLHAWVNGTLELQPLLDVSATLGCKQPG